MANKFRLPTKEEFKRLCDCYTRFDKERKGRFFYDEETGENLFLPCNGFRYGNTLNNDFSGYYWMNAYYNRKYAYFFCFVSSNVNPSGINLRCSGHSVRLVSDEPFEGAIHVAGLYWKPENEDGYYTYDEAMEKFDAK